MSNDPHVHTTNPNDPAPGPEGQSLLLRVAHTYRRAGAWLAGRARHTGAWAREQDRSMLGWFLGLSAAAVLLGYAALRLLSALVSALWSWTFGGSETPAPAPAPPPPDSGDGPPGWLVNLPQQPLWSALGDNLVGWFQHQAALAGIPAVVLLISWAVAGALLLLAVWFAGQPVQQVAWWAWLATSCWLIWLHTPGGSPIPAALMATVGVVISTVPIVGLLIALAAGTVGVLIVAS